MRRAMRRSPSVFLYGALAAAVLTAVVLALVRTVAPPPVPSVASEEPADELPPPAAPDSAAVIADLVERVEATYVFPDKVAGIAVCLRQRRAAGEYDGVDVRQLAQLLTEDLRGASGDLHFTVLWDEDAPPPPDPGEAAEERRLQAWRRDGYGFSRVEVLDGNVGLVELSAFVPPRAAAATAEAAFALVAGTDALIFDLRNSGGGSAEMVAYLVAHLFPGEPFLLTRFYWRPTDATHEVFTPAVEGGCYLDRPVFVLTSGKTPSAAEGFSYHLKHLGRATLVGEPTAGAAHPVVIQHLDAAPLQVYLPAGRAISPVTGSNWEGVGVIPQVEVPAAEALDTAHALALDRLLETETDPRWLRELRRVREGLEVATGDEGGESIAPDEADSR